MDKIEQQPGRHPLASVRWLLSSVLCCLLGMATKEVMVSAPLMVLLYDRTFVAGTFRAAWEKRRRFYAGLAGTWLLLGYLVAGTGSRGGTVGFGSGITWWSYALTQFGAIVHYLRLSLWPSPLVFDYGTALATRAGQIVPSAAVVILLLAGTILALWRRPAVGFLGAWFFAILAPSSSVLPLFLQTMAEHRMYLALAAVIVLVVLGLHALIGRRSVVVCLILSLGLGALTARRNEDYRSALSLWTDTVAKCPNNERAHNNLGNALMDVPGRLSDAMAQYEIALQINPGSAEPHNNLGNALLKAPGRLSDAMAQCEAALQINPDYAEAHNNLGNALLQVPGRWSNAVAEYRTALRLQPDYAAAHYNLGNAFFQANRFSEALGEYEAAIQLKPDYAEAHNNLGNALAELNRLPEAVEQYERALRIDPNYVNARKDLEQVQKALAP